MTLTLTNPLDMHLHLRDGPLLEAVVPYSARSFAGALIMPNLIPPIASITSAKAYIKRIKQAINNYARRHNISQESLRFEPCCALYLTDSMTPSDIEAFAHAGLTLLKLYPKGATTNSHSGVANVLDKNLYDVFRAAEEYGLILCVHGESAGFVMDREWEFGAVFRMLATTFPRLKIIIEHMSDARTIPLLHDYEHLYATLTLHHISLDLDDVIGGGCCMDHFCKPVLKTPRDKEALLELALQAHKKVSFGSDSAPHDRLAKISGAAGIFSAPCLLPQLAELFARHHALEHLQAFVSDNAMEIYQLPIFNELQAHPKIITLTQDISHIPESIAVNDSYITPLRHGEMLSWKEI